MIARWATMKAFALDETMKLVSCIYNEQAKIGAVVDDMIVLANDDLPNDMAAFLAAGPVAMERMRDTIVQGGERVAIADVTLRAPVPRPGKFLGIGLNYADHIGETGRERPEHPMFFTKQSTCVIGAGQAIHCPAISEKVDYEGELGIVIGKRCKHVDVEKAHEVIAGYTICNDVTVRDW